MKWLLFAGVTAMLCAVVLTSFTVSAETKRQDRVTIAGCPYPGVTANCLMIKAVNGPAYNITAIQPRPRASGRVIRVRGTVTDKMSVCGEGIVLDRIRWTRTRQLCPN
jgi:hypothetical protein